MSALGAPQELLLRSSTNNQHTKGQGHVDTRRGRKKSLALAKAAHMSTTSESQAKTKLLKSNLSGSQQASLSKGAKKNSLKQSDRHPKNPNLSRSRSINDKTKTLKRSVSNMNSHLEPSDMEPLGHENEADNVFSKMGDAEIKRDSGILISYSSAEIRAAGPVFADPLSLGFMKRERNSAQRPSPRYMLIQPRLLVPPPFVQDPWDEQNQRKMLQIERENAGADFQGTYEEFQKMREVERKRMEELGLVDAENTRKDLSEAIFFQGTCLDMCPIFERTRRSLENNVKDLEKDPQTNKISRDRAIKAFSRPAAGQPPPMPSDVRPPHVLSSTLDYMIQEILPHLPEAHSFIWDRTRSIRQDFIYQNYYGPAAIDCNEKIVRIHLLSLHIMPGSDVEFSQQQELEQLNKALQTLTEIYQDVRNHGGQCPNEAEFRAYHMISHFRDCELERDVQMLPKAIFEDHMIQIAIVFRTLMSQNNIVERGYTNIIGATDLFVEFFRLVFDPKTPLLLTFLLETHFNEIRFYALKSLTRSYHTKGKPFSGQSLQQMLGFDTIDELVAFVSYYDVDIIHEQGEVLIDLCNKEKLETQYKLNSLQAKPKRTPAHSTQLSKLLEGKSFQNLVCAGHSNSNLHIESPRADTILEGKISKTNPALQSNAPAKSTQLFTPKHVAFLAPATASTPTLGFGGRVIPANSLEQSISNQSRNQGDKTINVSSLTPGAFAVPNATQVSKLDSSTKVPTSSERFGSMSQPPALFSNASIASTSEIKPNTTSFISNTSPHFNFGLKSDAANRDSPNGVMEKLEKEKNKSDSESEISKKKETKSEQKESLPSGFQQNSGFSSKKQFSVPAVNSGLILNSKSNTSSALPVSDQIKKEEKSKLKLPRADHPKFSDAVEKVYEHLIGNAVNDELHRVIEKLQVENQERMNRQRVIDALSQELYQAFVLEQLHKAAWLSLAKHFREQKLKKQIISRVKLCCKRSVQSQEIKKKRLEELKSVQFKHPSVKRRRMDCDEITTTKQFHYSPHSASLDMDKSNTSIVSSHEPIAPQSFVVKQAELERLWAPMDLEPFAKNILKRVKLRSSHLFRCLLVVEDWKSSYSKWLNTKFNLRLSDDRTFYKHSVRERQLEVTFESLPKQIKSMENSFSHAPFIIFESGIFEASHKSEYLSLRQKLDRDSQILQKLLKICEKFSLYKILLLVIVWDTTESGITSKQLLEYFQSEIHSECIQKIDVCNMCSNTEELVGVLDEKVMQMSRQFKAELTERGVRKRKQLETQKRRQTVDSKLEPSPVHQADVRRASEDLQQKEAQAFKKAMQVQKHSFLSKHASFNRSMDLSNTSGVMRTANTTLANMTLHNLNHSILGNNTFLNSNDLSFLRNYGGAVENTRSEVSFSQPPVPKKLQELRDLTASVKARYVPTQTKNANPSST